MRDKKLILLILVAAAAGITALLLSGNRTSSPGNTGPLPDTPKQNVVEAHTAPRKFGLAVDSFNVIENTVQKNDFLGSILEPYSVENTTIAKLAQKSKPIFDVRRITAGSQYTIFCTKDSLQKAVYFVYQPNAIDYILYDLRDTITVTAGKREVTTKVETASGVITSSLYEALDKAGNDPALAMRLADIYAWTIDFYKIQQGDFFKVVYEQRYVKDEPVEPGQVRSAIFSHEGDIYYAFQFQPDSTHTGDYYDENGKSLRKAFLKAPLKFSRITSRFTMKRFHPVQKRWKAHLGTDYGAPTGTPIISTGSGTVIESSYSRNNGNFVKVRHNNTYTTQYLHMSRRAVKRGQAVRQGQVIGYVGSTGLATGPHVCYRFWKNQKQVDPYRQKFPAATPISENSLPAFNAFKQEQQQLLQSIGLNP
ncbi:MAG: peptidoglycan DD-metalloendopeptidase family protein [Chitinophagaceae bacterium]|nr:peptidoglycan DD-metalloendopeptidase family protein [Chitinophagaceae bacterium]